MTTRQMKLRQKEKMLPAIELVSCTAKLGPTEEEALFGMGRERGVRPRTLKIVLTALGCGWEQGPPGHYGRKRWYWRAFPDFDRNLNAFLSYLDDKRWVPDLSVPLVVLSIPAPPCTALLLGETSIRLQEPVTSRHWRPRETPVTPPSLVPNPSPIEPV